MRRSCVLSLVCWASLGTGLLLADPPEGLEASFRFGSTTAIPGSDVRLPVYVSSNQPLAGLVICVDFDEAVLECTSIELVYQRPDGKDWDPQVIYLDVNVNGKSNINNSNETPGNAGVDEGYLYGAVVFWPEEGFKAYRDAGGTMENLLPPLNVENEILAVHFKVRPEAPPGDTQVRFMDGVPSVTPGVILANEAALQPGYDAALETRLGVIGVSGLIAIVPEVSLFLRGDSNGDAVLDLSDAVNTLTYLFKEGFPLLCLDAADSNDDGTVDISDAIALLMSLFVTGQPLPAPSDAPGEDPTGDSLDCLTGIR